MNYYPFHIGDFRSGTVNMSRQTRWIYRDMLDVYYDSEKLLPLDLDVLCDVIGAESDDERRIVERLLRFKFIKTDEGYRQDTCERVIAEYHKKAVIAQTNGKLGGRPKKAAASEDKPSGLATGSDLVPAGVANESQSQTNQEPITNNHITTSTPDGVDVASDAGNLPPSASKPDCPHKEIIALYHEVLPQCPKVRDWTPARSTQLRARWNEAPDRQSLDYWRRFFEYVKSCPFLVGAAGTAPGRQPFIADLEWMTKSSNFTKIREQKYES